MVDVVYNSKSGKIKRIFITGSTGFIGRNLVKALLNKNYDILCLVRNAQKIEQLKKMGANIVIGHLENPDEWKKVLGDCDAVVHLASIRGEQCIPWDWYYKINVLATAKLLKNSMAYGVPKFIYFSSVGVLGTSPKRLPADESTPYNPDCKYHESKMLAELAILKLSQKNRITNTIIVRPTITYGSHDTGFLYSLLRYAKKGILPIFGNGENLIHLLYVKGLIQATIKILEKNPKHTIYMVADKNPMKYKELVLTIMHELKQPIRRVYIPALPCFVAAKAYDSLVAPIIQSKSLTLSLKIASSSWYYKIDRIITDLDYKPYETPNAIVRTIRWYVENNAI